MKYFLLPCLFCLFVACNDGDKTNPALPGVWGLEAIYNDPGDGSGDFVSIDSGTTIEFLPENRYLMSNAVCLTPVTTGETATGSYDVEAGTLSPDLCDFPFEATFKIEDGKLIISLPCIEACLLRFSKE